VYGFVTMGMLSAGALAITKIDVAPVSATTCVGVICITFTWCSTVLVQLDVTIMISLSSLAQYVEARQS
jgi:hypothetical protein